MTRIVTIASGKGGTGKTWLALSLAQAYACIAERRVLVVDADWGLANVEVQLGIRAPRGLAAGVQTMPAAGIDVLATASGSGRLADLSAANEATIARRVAQLADGYDRVVVDLPAGARRATRDWWRLGRERLLLATPDPASLTDAYAFLKRCRQDGDTGRVRIVMNRASSRSAGEAAAEKLERAARHFLNVNVDTVAVLLEEPRVGAAIRSQRPFVPSYPHAPMTQALEALAQRLDRAQNPIAQPSLRLSEPAT